MIVKDLEIIPNVYYTPVEVATKLRISRQRVQNMLSTGAARGIKIGRNWRILGSELLQLSRTEPDIDAELTRSMMLMSEPAFRRAWDNDEDTVYDDL